MSASSGALRWAVKTSFIDYIQGLSDGLIDSFDGCVQDGDEFVFRMESLDESGHLFSGGVQFTGFAGMLDVRLVDLMIEADGAQRKVTALVGARSIAARATIATFDDADAIRDGERWTVTPRLTFEGVRIFGDVYQVGAELAPMTFVPEPA